MYMSYQHKYTKYKNKYLNLKNQMAGQQHYLIIQNPPYCPTFDYIKSGVKTVEGRKYTEKYHNYKQGDTLIFECNGEQLKTKIKNIRLYGTLEDYLTSEGYDKVLPCAKSFNDAVEIYNKWSSEKDRIELKNKYGYGFMAIEIELVY